MFYYRTKNQGFFLFKFSCFLMYSVPTTTNKDMRQYKKAVCCITRKNPNLVCTYSGIPLSPSCANYFLSNVQECKMNMLTCRKVVFTCNITMLTIKKIQSIMYYQHKQSQKYQISPIFDFKHAGCYLFMQTRNLFMLRSDEKM